MISYPIDLIPDDNDTTRVRCPDLPGVNTFGETEAEAIRWASCAIEEWIAGSLHHFKPIARPSAGAVRATISLHTSIVLELYWALTDRGMTRADLKSTLGWSRTAVDRLFDPNHKTKLSRFEAAFLALGFEPDITLRPLAQAHPPSQELPAHQRIDPAA